MSNYVEYKIAVATAKSVKDSLESAVNKGNFNVSYNGLETGFGEPKAKIYIGAAYAEKGSCLIHNCITPEVGKYFAMVIKNELPALAKKAIAMAERDAANMKQGAVDELEQNLAELIGGKEDV